MLPPRRPTVICISRAESINEDQGCMKVREKTRVLDAMLLVPPAQDQRQEAIVADGALPRVVPDQPPEFLVAFLVAGGRDEVDDSSACRPVCSLPEHTDRQNGG